MSRRSDDQFDVRVLGPISVACGEGPLDPGGHKPRLLLALLLADVGVVVSADRLIGGLWGEDPPSTARKTLQVHVSNLRRGLGSSFPLRTVRSGYTVDAECVTIDSVLFESEVRRGSVLEAPQEASGLIAGALGRWTGPAYADVADEDAMRAEVARLNDLRLLAIELRVDADLRLGRHAHVVGELEVLTTEHPYRERFRMQHMVALYRAGRQAESLRAYERTRRLLADDLGVDPAPELRALHQEILEQSPNLDLDVVHDGAVTTDDSAWSDDARSGYVGVDASSRRSVGVNVRGYELRERLGSRGSSAVFRAYQASVGREVALKIVAPELANDPEFVKRFDAECDLLAELEHPHILTLLDYWRDPDSTCMAMPLMRGGTLARSVERAPLGAPAALRLLDQIGGALSYAHRRGVIHRDLRSTNVLLDEDGNAYLSDFRFSAIGGPWRTESENPFLASMTPEEFAGRPVGPSGDVYGLALLTCEMLTGTRPPPGQRPNAFAFSPFELSSAFDDVIAQATDPDPNRRYERVEAYLRALRQSFGADVVSGAATDVDDTIRNPYKGLRAFAEADAGDFFGRDDLLRALIDQVTTNNVTAVVGPSGSGKSSLVRAGLVPAARRGGLGRDVVVAEMSPGSYPFEELESALLRVAVERPDDLLGDLCADDRGLKRASKLILPDDDTDLLLIIDQFEELFALTSDDSVRNAFLASLVCVANDDRSRVRVVLTLRADFFDRPLSHSEFGQLMTASMVAVTLPSDLSLSEAIARPAHRVGLDIEPGLIPTILRDLTNQPGALPLLQYSLTELADTREGNRLTVAGYARTGGVLGALARRAEEIYSGLSPSGQNAAQAMFLRLVSVRDDTDDTRRRVRRSELEALGLNPQSLASVIDAYGSFRLLSFDRDPITRGPTVEVAHEALIREWPRYRTWIDDARDELRTERQLEAAVGEWDHNARDPSVLISGGRLERYEEWAGSTNVHLTEDERMFLAHSRSADDARRTASTTRRRRILAAVSLLATVALALAVVAVVQRDRADDQASRATAAAADANALRADAERGAAIDAARTLAARSTALDSSDISPLLALAAYDRMAGVGATDEDVTSALYQSIYGQRIVSRFTGASLSKTSRPSSPDGTKFAVNGGSTVSIVNASTGDVLSMISVPRGAMHIEWDLGEDLILIGTVDGAVELWSPSGELVQSLDVSNAWVYPVAIANGQVLYVQFAGWSFSAPTLVARDLSSEAVVFEKSVWDARAVEPSPDRKYVVVDERDLGFVVYRAGSWDEVGRFDLDSGFARLASRMHWVSGSDQIWILSDGQLALVDALTGEVLRYLEGESTWTDAWPSPDGAILAISADSSTVMLLDSTTGAVIDRLEVDPGPPIAQTPRDRFDRDYSDISQSIEWTPTGRNLIVEGWGATTIWRLDRPNAAEVVWPATDFAPVVTAELSTGELLLADQSGHAEIFDQATGRVRSVAAPDAGEADAPPVMSADGSTIVLSSTAGVGIYDAANGEIQSRGPAHLTRPLGISQDGRWLVAGTSRKPADRQHSIAIVDTRSGEVHASLGSLIDGEAAVFTSDEKTVAVAVTPFTQLATGRVLPNSGVWLVDVLTGDVLVKGAPQECITSLDVSDDDALIVAGACDGRVSLFDTDVLYGEEPWKAQIGGTEPGDSAVVGVAFTPDAEAVIVTRSDGSVESFDANSGFARRWVFDVGDHVGIPTVRDGLLHLGVTDPISSSSSSGGGMIGMPLDVADLADLARSSVTRDLTDHECQEYLALSSCAER